MEVGWIVGMSVSVLVLITGIAGLVRSSLKKSKNKWPWWLILFAVFAIVSGFINLRIFESIS